MFSPLSENVEVFGLEHWIRLHDDILLSPVLEIVDGNIFAALQGFGDFGIHTQSNFFTFEQVGHFPDFLLNLVSDSFR